MKIILQEPKLKKLFLFKRIIHSKEIEKFSYNYKMQCDINYFHAIKILCEWDMGDFASNLTKIDRHGIKC